MASVAPRAGAWIETYDCLQIRRLQSVAPRAGAWIETDVFGAFCALVVSHPVRVRGLKLFTLLSP